jgi:hypothetical protein
MVSSAARYPISHLCAFGERECILEFDVPNAAFTCCQVQPNSVAGDEPFFACSASPMVSDLLFVNRMWVCLLDWEQDEADQHTYDVYPHDQLNQLKPAGDPIKLVIVE